MPAAIKEAADRGFVSEGKGDAGYEAALTRSIAVGGGSNRWAGVATRMHPTDFQIRTLYGLDQDWPIRYEDLAPHYCEAEKLLLVEGRAPVAGAEPPRRCSFPIVLPGSYQAPAIEDEGRPLHFFPVAHSRRSGAALRLREKEIPRFTALPKGTLLTLQRVSRLVTEDGQSIGHAELKGEDGTRRRIYARRFVVAAGAIESARLLLQSRSSWFPAGLGNNHDLVGRRFRDHPCLWRQFGPADLLMPHATMGSHRCLDFYEPARRRGLSAYHVQLVRLIRNTAWALQTEMEPSAANRVTLSPSQTDPRGDPLPIVSLSWSDRDRRTEQAGQLLFRAQAEQLAERLGKKQEQTRWRAHPSGTTVMGRDPQSGVVDRDLKVFGVSNLYVSGSSVFPTDGTANPVLTVVALTLRLAKHLVA